MKKFRLFGPVPTGAACYLPVSLSECTSDLASHWISLHLATLLTGVFPDSHDMATGASWNRTHGMLAAFALANLLRIMHRVCY